MLEYIHQLDTTSIYAIQSIGPSWYGVAWLLSAIIGASVILVPTTAITLFLIGKKRVAIETLAVFLLSVLAVYVLKALIVAARPFSVDALVIQYAEELTSGMPSGHALISLAVLGWVWFRHPKSVILSTGIPALILFIGLSRVYLGVHYPSQVIAGWVVGGLLLWIFWWLERFLFRPRSSYVRRGK